MRPQIEIGAIRDAHQLVPLPFVLFALREEAILNIDGALGVVGQFFFRLFVKPQIVALECQCPETIDCRRQSIPDAQSRLRRV